MNPNRPKDPDPSHPKEIPTRQNPDRRDPVQDPTEVNPRKPSTDVENIPKD
jgi:hypothetical protein